MAESQRSGNGPIRTSNAQRRSMRYRQRANDLFCDTLKVYLGMKNKWISEHEIASLSPACINELNELYQYEFKQECPWFNEKLADEEAKKLDLLQTTDVTCLNVEAPEFKPLADDGFDDEFDEENGEESALGSELPTIQDNIDQCPEADEDTPTTHDLTFGDFEPKEVEAVASGITKAAVFDETVADFLNDWSSKEKVRPILTFNSPESGQKFYRVESMLGKLLAHCECSILVKSLIDRGAVNSVRIILKSVAADVALFIYKIMNDKTLRCQSPIVIVNSLACDHMLRTQLKLINKSTRIRLACWISKLQADYMLNRLSAHLPSKLRPKHYRPRPPRRRPNQNGDTNSGRENLSTLRRGR